MIAATVRGFPRFPFLRSFSVLACPLFILRLLIAHTSRSTTRSALYTAVFRFDRNSSQRLTARYQFNWLSEFTQFASIGSNSLSTLSSAPSLHKPLSFFHRQSGRERREGTQRAVVLSPGSLDYQESDSLLHHEKAHHIRYACQIRDEEQPCERHLFPPHTPLDPLLLA